jgi:PHD-finger
MLETTKDIMPLAAPIVLTMEEEDTTVAAKSSSPSTRWSARRKQRPSKKKNTDEESVASKIPSRQQRLPTRNPSTQNHPMKQRPSMESCESEAPEHPPETEDTSAEEERMTNPLIADFEEQGTMALRQLQKITDGISFHRPDTYSLRYMAQLLGLQNVLNADGSGMVAMEQLQLSFSTHESSPKAVDDPIFHVPNAIPLPKQAPFWITTPDEERNLLQQEQPQGRWLDPFYVQLWSHPPKLVPITTVQHARVLEDMATPGDSVLERVLRTAASLSLDTDDPQGVSFVPLEEAQTLPVVANLMAALPPPHGVVSGWVALETKNPTAVVAVVLYRFEWCAAAAAAPMEDAAEMIVHLLGCSVFRPSDVWNEAEQVWIRLILLSLVFEQARACHVWYALMAAADDRRFVETYFGMVAPGYEPWTLMIGDLHHHSIRYSFLQYRETYGTEEEPSCWKKESAGRTLGRHRWLVRFPRKADVAFLLPSEQPLETNLALPFGIVPEVPKDEWMGRSSTFSPSNDGGARSCSNPLPAQRTVTVAVSAVFSDHAMTLHRLNPADGVIGAELSMVPFVKEPPSLHLLRDFPLPPTTAAPPSETSTSPIHLSLTTKQKELADLEQSLTPTVCRLFSRVVEERVAYENVEATAQRERERDILRESRQVLERRREQDLAWQKQLEQDMDAVCEICGDGEVIPDNQILFCEACNVAVHQMCYGIERVPEGDYYCIPCRRLGRGKRLAGAQQRTPTPLPICCELCPLRQGAFVRTDVKSAKDEPARDRWVHVLCAKWLGLDHVDKNVELVEDVTTIRMDFRRHRIKCELCLGERGGMNRCMHQPSCNKWFHVTCARSVGTMRVVHGENCHGEIDSNPWQLFCPEHSGMASVDISKNAISVDALIRAAKEFPPEPMPPPIPKPFVSLTGPERKILLAEFSYEQALIKELLFRKVGARCEVCDVLDDDYKSWARCVACNVMFCKYCQVDCDDTKGNYKCPSCQYVDKSKKEKSEYEAPSCCTCIQKGGLLRESFAIRAGTKFMKNNRHAYEKSLFAKQSWVHELCAV